MNEWSGITVIGCPGNFNPTTREDYRQIDFFGSDIIHEKFREHLGVNLNIVSHTHTHTHSSNNKVHSSLSLFQMTIVIFLFTINSLIWKLSKSNLISIKIGRKSFHFLRLKYSLQKIVLIWQFRQRTIGGRKLKFGRKKELINIQTAVSH